MSFEQLAWVWWSPPERRVSVVAVGETQDDDSTQISIAEWLWAFGHEEAAAKFCAIPQDVQWAKAYWGFTQTEQRVLDAVLLRQWSRWHDRGKPQPMGSADFRFITRLDRRTIRNGLRSLEELRVISVKRRGRGRRSLYAVNAPEGWLRKSSSTRRPAAPTYIGAIS